MAETPKYTKSPLYRVGQRVRITPGLQSGDNNRRARLAAADWQAVIVERNLSMWHAPSYRVAFDDTWLMVYEEEVQSAIEDEQQAEIDRLTADLAAAHRHIERLQAKLRREQDYAGFLEDKYSVEE